MQQVLRISYSVRESWYKPRKDSPTVILKSGCFTSSHKTSWWCLISKGRDLWPHDEMFASSCLPDPEIRYDEMHSIDIQAKLLPNMSITITAQQTQKAHLHLLNSLVSNTGIVLRTWWVARSDSPKKWTISLVVFTFSIMPHKPVLQCHSCY